jgi:uncharacterized surface protein with fasciclin (FAS1) repeats
LFEDPDLTVGTVREGGEQLNAARETVTESAAEFQEAVTADTTPGVDVELVEPESIERVQEAESAFDAAVAGVRDSTPLAEAGVRVTSAAYQLQVAWVLLFADAGCIEDEAQATQWVSDYVSALQTDLRAAGYYTGNIDGVYGPQTIEAVQRLQEDAGLEVTGLLDPASQAALAAALGRQSSAEIGALQGIMIATGYYEGPIDGVWSDAVEASLKAMQTDLGVPATGVVDAETLRAFQDKLEANGVPPPTTTSTEPPPPTTGTTEAPATTTTEAPTTTAAETTTTTQPAVEDNILQVLEEAGNFTQFLAAVDGAGLTDTLSGGGPFTVFAPTDDAFATFGDLPTDETGLSDLVRYHYVEDDLTAFELTELTEVASALGAPIGIQLSDGFIVLNDAATITISNVDASNGVVHVINAVLTPVSAG